MQKLLTMLLSRVFTQQTTLLTRQGVLSRSTLVTTALGSIPMRMAMFTSIQLNLLMYTTSTTKKTGMITSKTMTVTTLSVRGTQPTQLLCSLTQIFSSGTHPTSALKSCAISSVSLTHLMSTIQSSKSMMLMQTI